VPTKKIELPKLKLEGSSPTAARKGDRPVYWPPEKDFRPTPIFTYESLRPGNVVEGPAIVEGEYTTLVVPPALHFTIDNRGLGILETK
jgi:N-methylhydantoinase A/oxoprolinase/acetone carboxylase beta subunit